MALQVYVDDSGTGGDSPVFILAGCEAEASQWAVFTDKWHEALKEYPAINYFKASECFSQRGEFVGWENHACSQKAAALASIINNHANKAFVFTVDTNDFAEVFKGKVDFRYDNPYFLMAYDLCEQLLAIQINDRGRMPIEIIFDHHDTISVLINQLYLGFRDASIGTDRAFIFEEVMPKLPSFQDEKKAFPLQAADMVAWLFRRVFGNVPIPYDAGPAWDRLRDLPIDVFSTDMDFLKQRYAEIADMRPDGKLYFHQLAQSRLSFDQRISDHNFNLLCAGDDYPTLVSVSSKQMRQRLLLKSCMEHGTPHLHTRDGKECLAASGRDLPTLNRLSSTD